VRPRAPVGVLLACLSLAWGCAEEPDPEAVAVPDPLQTARDLLALHDVLGRQPEERPDRAKQEPVDRRALAALISDLDGRDPFVTDLYVGFVVGALARYQKKLVATASAGRATVVAGRARVAMRLEGERWKVVLEESVPAEIKERAAAEKRRFEEARDRSGN
jgi:hypothetical protein